MHSERRATRRDLTQESGPARVPASMGRLVLALLALLVLAAPARADLASEVDPLAGTFAPGFVFPGADTPFGMVQNSPDTRGEFAYSGYLYSDPTIGGFSLVHLSGPGVRRAATSPSCRRSARPPTTPTSTRRRSPTRASRPSPATTRSRSTRRRPTSS